jgi:hypothetical protein
VDYRCSVNRCGPLNTVPPPRYPVEGPLQASSPPLPRTSQPPMLSPSHIHETCNAASLVNAREAEGCRKSHDRGRAKDPVVSQSPGPGGHRFFYLAFKGPAAEGEGLIGCTTVVSGSPR